MRLKVKSSCFVLLSALFLLCGCQTVLPLDLSMSEKDQAVVAIGNRMLAAFIDNAPARFVAELPAETRERFTIQQFNTGRQNITEAFGQIVECRFLTKLESPALVPYLWRVRFMRHGMVDLDKTIYQEILFRIVVGELDGKPYIETFGFN